MRLPWRAWDGLSTCRPVRRKGKAPMGAAKRGLEAAGARPRCVPRTAA
jgi:hypothetical protein